MPQQRGLLLILGEVPGSYEQCFNEWYDEDHAPARLTVPGIITARRYQELTPPQYALGSGPARNGALLGRPSARSNDLVSYLAVYELDDLDLLTGSAYQALGARRPSPLELEVQRAARFDRRVYRLTRDAAQTALPAAVCSDYLLCQWRSTSESVELTMQVSGCARRRSYALEAGDGPDTLLISDVDTLNGAAAFLSQSAGAPPLAKGEPRHNHDEVRLFRLYRRFDHVGS
jgi:hypothetical protein